MNWLVTEHFSQLFILYESLNLYVLRSDARLHHQHETWKCNNKRSTRIGLKIEENENYGFSPLHISFYFKCLNLVSGCFKLIIFHLVAAELMIIYFFLKNFLLSLRREFSSQRIKQSSRSLLLAWLTTDVKNSFPCFTSAKYIHWNLSGDWIGEHPSVPSVIKNFEPWNSFKEFLLPIASFNN